MLPNNKTHHHHHHHTYGGGGGGGGAGLKKGPWSAAEDAILTDYVRRQGEGNWNAVQRNTQLRRCGKSCRLRWANHLRPNLKKGAFSSDEERVIVELHSKLGNKWARISSHLPGRTDNEVKNYWNTRVKRRLRHGLPLYPNTTLQNLPSSSSSPSPSPSSPPPPPFLSSSSPPSPPPPIPLFKITPPSLSFFNPITIPFHPPPTTTTTSTTSLFPTFHPPPPPLLLSPPPPFVNHQTHHYRCFSSTQLNPFEDVVQKKSGGPVGLGFYNSNYNLDGQTTTTTQIETESSSSLDPFGNLGFHEPNKIELPSNQFCPQLLSADGYDQEHHRAEDGGGRPDVETVEAEDIPNYEDRRGNSGLLDALLQEARCRARGERVKREAAAAAMEYGGGGGQLDGSTFGKSLGGTMKKEQQPGHHHSNSMMTMMNVVVDDELSNIFSLIPSFVQERQWCDDGQEASIVTDDNLAFDQLPPLTHFSVDGEDEWAGGSFDQQIGTTSCQGLVQNSYASF